MPLFYKVFGLFERINRYIFLVGAAFMLLLGAFTIRDVAGRYLFGRPLQGNLELSSLAMSVIIFLCFGYSFTLDAHIRVDLLTHWLSPRIKVSLEFIVFLLLLSFLVIMAWQGARIAFEQRGNYTDVLQIPTFPFSLLVPFGTGLACLSLIGQTVSALKPPPKEAPLAEKTSIKKEDHGNDSI
jgi:TRAP-type C4-dicarboxylate transport system permease small subunit